MKKRNERDFASLCGPNIIISGFKQYTRPRVWTFLWGANVASCITVIDPGLSARVSLGFQEIRSKKLKPESLQSPQSVPSPSLKTRNISLLVVSRRFTNVDPSPIFLSLHIDEQFDFGWSLLLLRGPLTISVPSINQSYSRFHLGS